MSDSLLSGKRCFVLDDEFLIALDIQQILERAGAAYVASVATAAEAVALLGRENRLRPDLSLRRRTAVLVGAVLAMAVVIWILKAVTEPGALSLATVIGVSGMRPAVSTCGAVTSPPPRARRRRRSRP